MVHLPQLISHRGVSNKWDSNTSRVLGNYSTTQTRLGGTDVQETKDGQFVMMHDTNLKNLGINKSPQDLNLEELKG